MICIHSMQLSHSTRIEAVSVMQRSEIGRDLLATVQDVRLKPTYDLLYRLFVAALLVQPAEVGRHAQYEWTLCLCAHVPTPQRKPGQQASI
jgi:hypothetical protein